MSGNVISAELKRQLGRTLRHHRNRVGLSQEDLSFRAGLHRTAVGQIERGERIARADTLIKLATGLGVSVAALVEGVTWEPSSFRPGGFAVGGGGRGNAED